MSKVQLILLPSRISFILRINQLDARKMATSTKQQQPQLILHRGWPDKGKYVWSPFVVKVEARLRFAGVNYEVQGGTPRTAPKGKIPYVEIRNASQEDNGSTAGGNSPETIADSTSIIKQLVERGILPDFSLRSKIDGPGDANDLAIRALMEDKLYFYQVCVLVLFFLSASN